MILRQKCKIGKGNLYLAKPQFGAQEINCAEDNDSYIVYMCTKEFSYSNFKEAVIGKISIFQEIPQNFTYLQKLKFLKYN